MKPVLRTALRIIKFQTIKENFAFFQAQENVLRSSVSVPSAPASSAWVNPGQPYAAAASATPGASSSSALGVYPGLADYMGMELTEDVIRENMPEYLLAVRQPVRLLHGSSLYTAYGLIFGSKIDPK